MDDQLLLGESQAELDRDMPIFRAWASTACGCRRSGTRSRPTPSRAPSPPASTARTTAIRATLGAAGPRRRLGGPPRPEVMVSISTPAPIWASGRPARPTRCGSRSVSEFADFSRGRRPPLRRPGRPLRHLQRAQPGRLAPAPERPHGPVSPRTTTATWCWPPTRASRRSTPTPPRWWASWRPAAAAAAAPPVHIRPLIFLREMACRDSRYRPVRRGRCRTSSRSRSTPSATTRTSCSTAPSNRSDQQLRRRHQRRPPAAADDRPAHRACARSSPGRRRRLSVYYTEFGYQTSPPDPFAGVA